MSKEWLDGVLEHFRSTPDFSSARIEAMRKNLDLAEMLVEGTLKGFGFALEVGAVPETAGLDREKLISTIAKVIHGTLRETEGELAMDRLLG